MFKAIVSTNVGNGFCKAVSNHFLGDGQHKAVVFPSVGALEQGALNFAPALELGENGRETDLIVEWRGERWALGNSAYDYGRMYVQDMSRSRIDSGYYQMLYATTLASTVRNSANLVTVASLPILWYNGDREAARQILSGEFTIRLAGKTRTYNVKREDCHIIPEGFGALCGRIMTSDGRVSDPEMARARVGVVDVGTRTVGLLRVDKLKVIPARSDMRDDLGVSTVWQLLRESINQMYSRTLDNRQIDETLRNRVFRDSGKAIDISDQADRASQALATAISSLINNLWDNGRDVDVIFLTGGGAQFVSPWLSTYPHLEVSPNGHFDNAEGGLRFALARGFGNGD